jgi:hypothetical protein
MMGFDQAQFALGLPEDAQVIEEEVDLTPEMIASGADQPPVDDGGS